MCSTSFRKTSDLNGPVWVKGRSPIWSPSWNSSQTFRAPDRRPTTNRQQDRQALSSVSSLFSNSSNSSECGSCAKGGHTIEQCFKFFKLTVAERYKLALNKALCFQCLKPGHLKRYYQDTVGECACPPQRTPHHKLLCETMDVNQANEHPIGNPTSRPWGRCFMVCQSRSVSG